MGLRFEEDVPQVERDFRTLANDIIKKRLHSGTRVWFDYHKTGYSLYWDMAGQRDNYVVPAGNQDYNSTYVIKRYNTFENSSDVGTANAILGSFTVSRMKVISIQLDRIEFETLTVEFNDGFDRRRMNFQETYELHTLHPNDSVISDYFIKQFHDERKALAKAGTVEQIENLILDGPDVGATVETNT